MASPKTVAFHTLGCKLNFSETSSIRRTFEQAGYGVSSFAQLADIYVLNTCSVTEFADRKCRQAVRKVLRQNPDARIVVMGCYAQLKPEEIADIEGVDLVLGARDKFRLLPIIESLEKSQGRGMIQAGEITEVRDFQSSYSFGDRTRSFLKIQDGCDYNCSFCTIPLARGKSRSGSIEEVVENARLLGEKGIREIVLTGVNIGDFGKSYVEDRSRRKRNSSFLELIEALDTVENVERFRISSIEPNLCRDEIIDFVAQSKKFMPHFHMPLQSGNDKLLRRMRRRYDTSLYADRVRRIKTRMPDACIGVDVIVGFPGETEDDFEESFGFIHSLDISYLHVFTYSERPNTPAAEMPGVVEMSVRRERNHRLRILSEKKKTAFYEQFRGQLRTVLLEKSKDDSLFSGFTDNYIRVSLPFSSSHSINQLIDLELKDMGPDGLMSAIPVSAIV